MVGALKWFGSGIGSLFGGLGGFFGSILSGLWVYLGVFLAGAAAATYITHAVMTHNIDNMKLAAARQALADIKNAVALDRTQRQISTDIGDGLQINLDNLTLVEADTLKKVKNHVTPKVDRDYPLPCGLVRMHDSAVLGTDVASVSDPACKSDGAASGVKASDLATNDVENFSAARANAAQLKAWQDWYVQSKAAYDDWVIKNYGKKALLP